jgi:hypothetical protein
MTFRSRLKQHGAGLERNAAERLRRPERRVRSRASRAPRSVTGIVGVVIRATLAGLFVQCTSTSPPEGDSHGSGARVSITAGSGTGTGTTTRPSTDTDTVQKPEVVTPARADNTVTPAWTKDEISKIQRELARLGLYRLAVDGTLGVRTADGLVEAFGDHTWRTMTAPDAVARLAAARPPAGHKGEHALRLGEMFADGLLDVTFGLGFDEAGWHQIDLPEMEKALTARSFVVNNARGIQLYRAAGRALPENPTGTFWVRSNGLTYKPPAGPARRVDVVVRFVSSPDGKSGGEAASAFKEGMVQSDATFYGGHGRYGSGPDFDRNFTIELFDAQDALEQFFDDYERLEKYLITEGKPHGRGAWAQFQWRVANHRITVEGDNQGNVRLTRRNPHPGEFGALLMFWNLDRPGAGAVPVTGPGGELAQATRAHPERGYRASVFDGCRADDYEISLRATPGMDRHATDTFASTISLYWDNMPATFAAFLDSFLGMQSAEDIAKAMDHVQTTTGMAGKGTFKAYGVDDNPIYR